MAEAAELEAGEEDELELAAPKGSRSKLIIILVSVLLLIVIGAGAGLHLVGVGPFAGAPVTAEGQEPGEEEEEPRGEAIYVDVPPAFTVNLLGESKARFLQVSVQALTRDAEVEANIKRHLPMIRNKLVLLFSGKTSQDLGTSDGKENLRKEAKAAIQKVLKSETGKGGIEAVFFTSFVMQ